MHLEPVPSRFAAFGLQTGETVLQVGIRERQKLQDVISYTWEYIVTLRTDLKDYIKRNPLFGRSLVPQKADPEAPEIARKMAFAGQKAKVGPLAAVAGVIAGELGQELIKKFQLSEIFIDNGGDIFLKIKKPVTVSVYAGNSPFSHKTKFQVEPGLIQGICTSSGSVGHAFSKGKADALTILSFCPGLSDAYATAFANIVKSENDLQAVVKMAFAEKDVLGAIGIAGERLAVIGNVKLLS